MPAGETLQALDCSETQVCNANLGLIMHLGSIKVIMQETPFGALFPKPVSKPFQILCAGFELHLFYGPVQAC